MTDVVCLSFDYLLHLVYSCGYRWSVVVGTYSDFSDKFVVQYSFFCFSRVCNDHDLIQLTQRVIAVSADSIRDGKDTFRLSSEAHCADWGGHVGNLP